MPARIKKMSKLIGHTSVNFNNEFILIFGGLLDASDHNGYSDQLRVYEISSQSCVPINISEGEKPSPRNFHTAIMFKNKMLIFGGKSNGYLNDLWQFEFCAEKLSGEWKKLSSTFLNGEISPRFGHSAEIYQDSMFVFGGYDSNGFISNELFELNLNSFEWKRWKLNHSTKNNRKNSEILGRYFHSSALIPANGLMIICSGKKGGSIDPVDDMLIIDLENRIEDECLNCKVKKIPQSLSRFGHKSWVENDTLFMIGGSNKQIDFTNLYCLDLVNSKNEWKEESSHYLSRTFNHSEVGPVFHTLTRYKICNEFSSSIIYFFIWGGKYQTRNFEDDRTNDGQLSILNDDILRMILEYFTPKDLNAIQLIRKKSLLSQLSTEDKLWKNLLMKKIPKNPSVDGMNIYSFGSQLSSAHQQFKNHIIEFERMKSPIRCQFRSKKEILKQDIQLLSSLDSDMEREFRVVFIGGSAVGKTTLQMVLSMNEYPQEYVPTVFETNNPLQITIRNESFTLNMIDTAGGYDYDIIRYLSYSPPPHLTIATYSIYNYESLLQIKNTFIPETQLNSPKTPILLLSTKTDLRNKNLSTINGTTLVYHNQQERRIVSTEEGEKLAKELNCISFTETSSLNMDGIEELKELIVKCCLLQNTQRYSKILHDNKSKCMLQ